MAVPIKDAIDISFAQGLDTKTDPLRVPAGKFLALNNMVFTTGGRLTKRNGFGSLTTLPQPATFLTTFNGNLTAIGQNLQAFGAGSNTWINKGTLQPLTLSTLPLIRSNTNQSSVDTVVSANNYVCAVYTDQTPTSLSTPRFMYSVIDSNTGQYVVNPTQIAASSGSANGSPRVFLLGAYFIIGFSTTTNHLQYIAVSTSNPTMATVASDLSSSVVSSSTLSWDGVVVGPKLFFAYNTTSGGQSIKVSYLPSTLSAPATPVTFSDAGKVTATIMSVSADMSSGSPIVYAAYYDSISQNGYALAVDQNLNKVLTPPVQFISAQVILNVTSQASNGVLTVFYEVSNSYSYDSNIPSNYISTNTITQSGTVGTSSIIARSVGLASKSFTVNGQYYFLAAYQSTFQPTYFLFNSIGQVMSRLAYSNGGGYLTVGLPSVSVFGSVAQVGYLFKDFITSQNTSTQQSITKSNIYSQTGINLVDFTIGTSNVVPGEIAQALHLSGGFLWEYDGNQPVEHNFFLWPDSVEGTPSNSGGAMLAQEYMYQVIYSWTDNQGNIHRSAPSIPTIVDMSTNNKAFTQPTPLTPTGTGTSGSFSLTVSSATGLQVGQLITDTTNPTFVQAGTYIKKIVGLVLTLSLPLAGSPAADALSISSICSVTLNIPTLRLTYKLTNPVKIEIYRWSVAQQEFFEVTSIQMPLINSTTVDSVSYVDIQADNQILGNSLIYTTGNVVENIGAPSFNSITLFDDRLWGIDAEDTNLLWFSKQVISATPVEMSDLFTRYVAPSIASQGSTGPLQCIAPLDDKLILFKKDAIYYINGTGPDNTGSNNQYSEPLFVTSVVGCANQQSIVFVPDGLMFQSDKGIWLLGRGMGVSYIGAPVEAFTLQGIVQSAVSVPGTTQVRFTLNSGITLIYDYFYQQWGTFSINAVSSTLYQGAHTYLDKFGRIFSETPGLYLDGSTPVVMNFTTAWINLAGLQGYQRAYHFMFVGQYISPHFLNVAVAYDYVPYPLQQTMIAPTEIFTTYGAPGPYGQQQTYGSSDPVTYPPMPEQWRIFFTQQRCEAFQVSIQEIFDPSMGVPAGQGLNISGLNLIAGFKSKYKTIRSINSAGALANA